MTAGRSGSSVTGFVTLLKLISEKRSVAPPRMLGLQFVSTKRIGDRPGDLRSSSCPELHRERPAGPRLFHRSPGRRYAERLAGTAARGTRATTSSKTATRVMSSPICHLRTEPPIRIPARRDIHPHIAPVVGDVAAEVPMKPVRSVMTFALVLPFLTACSRATVPQTGRPKPRSRLHSWRSPPIRRQRRRDRDAATGPARAARPCACRRTSWLPLCRTGTPVERRRLLQGGGAGSRVSRVDRAERAGRAAAPRSRAAPVAPLRRGRGDRAAAW